MSGRKNFLNNKQIITAGDASQATVTSLVLNIQGLDNIGIQANIASGTPTGTFDVQVSADHKEDNLGNVITAGNWVSIGTTYRQAITSGSPAQTYFDLNQLSSQYVRLLYTKGSGTGSIDAFAVGKMI